MQSRKKVRAKVKSDHRKTRASAFVAESLEDRTLFVTAYDYVTFASAGSSAPTGDGAVTVAQGGSVTVRAYVYAVSQYGPQYNPTPTGKVELRWYKPNTYGVAVGGPDVDLIPVSQGIAYADITTKLFNPQDSSIVPDAAGNFQMIGYYYGDDALFPEVSYPVGMVDTGPLQPDQQAFIGVKFTAGNSLAVTKQPTNTAAGEAIDPVTVSVLNASGSIDTSASGSISARLSSGITGTGTLGGTTTASIVNGVATFSNLTIDKSGQYALTFADAQGDTTASGLFKITGGKLVFLPPGPKDGSVGSPLKAFTVALEDSKNKIITTDSSTVVTLTPIGIKPNPEFTGNSVALVNGVATFSNLILKNPDFYKLQADDGGDTEAVSSRFKIAGDHLVVQHQPANGDAKAGIPLTIGIYNAANRLDTTATGAVQLSLNALTPGSTATLGGTITANFVGGVATFTAAAGPTIDTPGKYTFTVTELADSGSVPLLGTTTPITTRAFTIGGFHLVFTTKPAAADVDKALVFNVAAANGHNQIDTSLNSNSVQLTLTPIKNGVGGQLSTYTNPGFVSGVQTFSAGQSPAIDTPGTYSLTATEIDSSGAVVTTTAPVTFNGLKVTGYHLVFEVQPVDTAFEKPIPMSIEIQDAHGIVQTGFDSDFVTLSNSPVPYISYSLRQFQSGRIDFASTFKNSAGGYNSVTAEMHNAPAGSYTITAAVENSAGVVKEIEPATSKRFRLAGQHLVFVTQPPNVSVNQNIPFTVAVENARGQIDTDEDSAIIGLSTQSTAGLGYTAQTFSSGKVTFEPLVNAIGAKFSYGSIGRYSITATANNPDGTPIPTIAPVTSHLLRLLPSHLVFNTQPQSIGGGFPIPAFTVGLANANGDPVVDSTVVLKVDATFAPVHHGGPSGDLGTVTTVDSVAQFSLLYIHTPGTYTIKVTVLDVVPGSILSAVSVPIIISP